MLAFRVIDENIRVASAHVPTADVYGRPFTAEITIRIDSREGPFRVDVVTIGPWTAIDGGAHVAPMTLDRALVLAERYVSCVTAQRTLSPDLRIDP